MTKILFIDYTRQESKIKNVIEKYKDFYEETIFDLLRYKNTNKKIITIKEKECAINIEAELKENMILFKIVKQV